MQTKGTQSTTERLLALFLYKWVLGNERVLFCVSLLILCHCEGQESSYCRQCNIIKHKEDMIYHCEDCDVCIEEFDHHCIFLPF